MRLERQVAVVGSREFQDYQFLNKILAGHVQEGDLIVSGGAKGADSMAQRWAKENGFSIVIHYPDYARYGRGAAFVRNKRIAEDADIVLAFYMKGRLGQGGTANTIEWAKKLEKPYIELEEP